MDADFIFDIDNYFSDDDDFELDVSTTAYLIEDWEVHIFRVLIPIVEFFLPCTQKVLVHVDCIVLHSDPISKVSRLLNLGRCR